MQNQRWQQVWHRRGDSQDTTGLAGPALLHALMDLNGYFSPTSSASMADHEVHFRYIVDRLGIGPEDSVFEVGCGAGALLYWLRTRCRSVGGADFAASLVAHAREALPESTDLHHCAAHEIDVDRRYDVVVSNGVFLYFPNVDYARVVVERMVAKARRCVAVLDVNDAARAGECERARAAKHGNDRDRYTGLQQIYLERDFFREIAAEHGLRCVIEDSAMPNSVNARFRYHVSMFRT